MAQPRRQESGGWPKLQAYTQRASAARGPGSVSAALGSQAKARCRRPCPRHCCPRMPLSELSLSESLGAGWLARALVRPAVEAVAASRRAAQTGGPARIVHVGPQVLSSNFAMLLRESTAAEGLVHDGRHCLRRRRARSLFSFLKKIIERKGLVKGVEEGAVPCQAGTAEQHLPTSLQGLALPLPRASGARALSPARLRESLARRSPTRACERAPGQALASALPSFRPGLESELWRWGARF